MLTAGAAGTVTGGRLADRFGRLPVMRVSFAATAAGLLAIVFTGLPWVFPAIAITGFALFQSFSLTVTLGQDYLPSRGALWWLVDRPNLFVKIPAARQGLPAISACLAEGISINVTLIFSLARYQEVIEAFLAGIEAARRASAAATTRRVPCSPSLPRSASTPGRWRTRGVAAFDASWNHLGRNLSQELGEPGQ